MKAFITGGTGFVGSHVCGRLLDLGWDVVITGRSSSIHDGRDRLTHIVCDTAVRGEWQEKVAEADVVVNLAGKNIFTQWNAENKLEIRESRILTTTNVVDAIPSGRGSVLLSTSASGFYGSRGDELLKEDSQKGSGFLSDLCEDWEKEAMAAEGKGVRVILMRFGVVLGKDGGAFKMMLNPFKFGLGGSMGSGNQWMPWMHIDDLVSAVLFLAGNENAKGPVNFCSPNAVMNKDFTKALASALGRPAFFSVPGFFLKTVLGELGEQFLGSLRMAASELTRLGFQFAFPEIDQAMADLVR